MRKSPYSHGTFIISAAYLLPLINLPHFHHHHQLRNSTFIVTSPQPSSHYSQPVKVTTSVSSLPQIKNQMKMKGKMTSIIRFRRIILKLRKCMLLMQHQPITPMILQSEPETPRSTLAPEDIHHQAGHFAVSTLVDGEEEKRFMVDLRQLSNPAFLKLLEQAKDEFGGSFRHEGALAVCCKPDELEKILEEDYLEGF